MACRLAGHRQRKMSRRYRLDLTSGEIVPIRAKTTLFATGGYGRVYLYSTNALINTGSGIGMAYKAGIPLKDMEFVQFHPTDSYRHEYSHDRGMSRRRRVPPE